MTFWLRKKAPWFWSALALSMLAASGGLVFAGAYDVGADASHWPLTLRLLETVRDRSVRTRASNLEVPDLEDPRLLAAGASHYDTMCVGCHLAPGYGETELRAGLYPRPPNLASPPRRPAQRSPAEQFWIIKHGLKMTAMPAWGSTHDDRAIWSLVAFVRRLPRLDEARYRALTASEAEPGTAHPHRHDAGHEHGGAPDPGGHHNAGGGEGAAHQHESAAHAHAQAHGH